jgi:hypothetical protein
MFSMPLSRWAFFTLSAAAVCCFGIQSASAQSLFGSGQAGGPQAGNSSFGNAGLARSTSPASGFSSSFGGGQGGGLNTGGLGGTGLGGAGGFGGGGLGGGLGGQAGMGGSQLNLDLGALSATVGQGGFIGRSDNAGRFVGNANTGQQSIQGTNAGGQFGGRGQQFGGGQFGGRNTTGGFNQRGGFNQQSRRTIRPQHRIAFDYSQPETGSVQTSLNAQFQRFQTSRPELQGVQIGLGDGREVVLRGQVRSEEDKKLAAQLARMEPGVRTVRNELTVENE